MECVDDLPMPALRLVLSFLYDDVAVSILRKRRGSCRPSTRVLAAVSKRWLSAIEAVEAHLRDSVLVFDFQRDLEALRDGKDAEVGDTTIYNAKEIIAAREAPSGLLFQLVRGIYSAFACTSSSPRLSEDEELDDVDVFDDKKQRQKKREEQHVENELNRLLEEMTTGKLRPRVELWLTDVHDITIFDVDDESGGSVLPQQWEVIFANCERLVRLDLSGLPIESDHLPSILKAAGTHCVNLEELVMPQQAHLMHRRRSVSEVIIAFHDMLASLDALSRSCSRKQGGLKRLVLPSLFPIEYVDATASAVGEHCPNLEIIEGLRLAAFSRRRRLTSVEMRHSSLQSWEAFCTGCTHLTALNWCSLPCSDEVFNIFALYPKVELKSLIIPGNTALWRRDYVLQERHHVEPLSPSSSFAPVLRACPNLTSLKVLLSDMQGDSECLEDQFLKVVADACPLLEKLALVESSIHHGFGPSNAFTSNGLKTLVNLRYLHRIELNGVEVSGRTLLLLAARAYSPNQLRTRIDVTLGVRGWTAVDVASRFHETILELLNHLSTHEACEYPAFIIRVRPDQHNFSPPAMWETRYVSEWNNVKRELVKRAPTIKFYYDYLRSEAAIECQEPTTVKM